MAAEGPRYLRREAAHPSEPIQAIAVASTLGRCPDHPEQQATWRCRDCGIELCATCVTPYRNALANATLSVPYAICPHCGGTCFDFRRADELARRELKEEQRKRWHSVKVAGAGAVASGLLTLCCIELPEIAVIAGVLFIVFLGVVVTQKMLDFFIGGDTIFPHMHREYFLLHDRHRPLMLKVLLAVSILVLLILFQQIQAYQPF